MIGQGYLGAIPIPVLIAFILFIIVSFILNKTYIGRYVFAIGGNVEAARLAGINVFGMKLFIASIAGFMTGVGAIILSARLGSVTANMGTGLEFTIITAVLLGGVSVRGERYYYAGGNRVRCVPVKPPEESDSESTGSGQKGIAVSAPNVYLRWTSVPIIILCRIPSVNRAPFPWGVRAGIEMQA